MEIIVGWFVHPSMVILRGIDAQCNTPWNFIDLVDLRMERPRPHEYKLFLFHTRVINVIFQRFPADQKARYISILHRLAWEFCASPCCTAGPYFYWWQLLCQCMQCQKFVSVWIRLGKASCMYANVYMSVWEAAIAMLKCASVECCIHCIAHILLYIINI